jgi:hypothetical protein
LTPFIYVCFYIGAENSNVVSVFLSKEYKLHTTRSWEFLGLEKDGGISLDSAWWMARFGEDTIMANLDSGIYIYTSFFYHVLRSFHRYFLSRLFESVCCIRDSLNTKELDIFTLIRNMKIETHDTCLRGLILLLFEGTNNLK